MARKVRMLAENEVLMKSYMEEKRKLEYQILKDNKKNEATQSMINKIYGEELKPPEARPQYKFEEIQRKYGHILRASRQNQLNPRKGSQGEPNKNGLTTMIGSAFGKKLQQTAITAQEVEISDTDEGEQVNENNLTNLIFFEGNKKGGKGDNAGAKRKYNY